MLDPSLSGMTLHLLMSAFGAGEPGETIKLGEDEALFWTWWCAQGAVRKGEELEGSVLFALVEVSLQCNLICDIARLTLLAFAAPLDLLIPLPRCRPSLPRLPTPHYSRTTGYREGGSAAYDPPGLDQGLPVRADEGCEYQPVEGGFGGQV